MNVSAQVVWDRLTRLEAGGVVDNYYINVNDSSGPIISVRVMIITCTCMYLLEINAYMYLITCMYVCMCVCMSLML